MQPMATFNGLKACGRQIKSRDVLMASKRTVAGRAGRSPAVIEARKVAVLGAAGGIGQPLSLLLKMNRMVTELSLYDIANVAGVAADLSHCNTPVKASWRCSCPIAGEGLAPSHPEIFELFVSSALELAK